MGSLTNAEQLAVDITGFLNGNSSKMDEVIKMLSTDHRTLQQFTTKLFLKWVEFAASDEYRHDGRNEATHKVRKKLMEGWEMVDANHKGSKPSQWLPCI